jgi:hypothetical protein
VPALRPAAANLISAHLRAGRDQAGCTRRIPYPRANPVDLIRAGRTAARARCVRARAVRARSTAVGVRGAGSYRGGALDQPLVRQHVRCALHLAGARWRLGGSLRAYRLAAGVSHRVILCTSAQGACGYQ